MTVKVKAGQTLLDITIQALGTASRVYEVAMLNSLIPSHVVSAGDVITMPEVYDEHASRLKFFKLHPPASGNVPNAPEAKEGIGHWQVGTNFIIQ